MSIAERWKKFRELPADIEQRLERLQPLFEQEVELAYLFGSLAQDQPGHDVDLALLSRKQPVFRLRPAIIERLGVERLDLVDLEQASPILRFEIVRTGRLLYAVTPLIYEQFELATLRLYRDTAPLRARHQEYLRQRIATWSSG